MARRAPRRQTLLFLFFLFFLALPLFLSPPFFILSFSEKLHLCRNAQTPDSEEIKFKLKFRGEKNKLNNENKPFSPAKELVCGIEVKRPSLF